MASSGRTLTIYLAADTKKAAKSMESFGDKLSKFAKVGAIAAAAGMALLAKEVADFVGASVDAAREAEVSRRKFMQVADQMGYTSKAYKGATDRAIDYASALSATLGIEDETIQAVQTKLLTFKALGDSVDKAGGAFDRATQAAFDLASAGFGQAESNAIQLGKALNDPVKGLTALAKAGVTFTEAEKERIAALVESNKMGEAQALILAAIEKQVGGTAEAAATSTDKMAVAWGELQESVGTTLLPTFDAIAEGVTNTVIPALDKIWKAVAPKVEQALDDAKTAFNDFAVEFQNTDFSAEIGMIDDMGESIGTVGDAWSNLYDTITGTKSANAEKQQHSLIGIMKNYVAFMDKVVGYYTTVWTGILRAAAAVWDAIFSIKDGIASFVEWSRNLDKRVKDMWFAIGRAITDGFKNGIAPLKSIIDGAYQAVANLPSDVMRILGIRSPSRVFMEIGGDIVKGFEIGISGLEGVTEAVAERFTGAVEKTQDRINAWIENAKDKLRDANSAFATFAAGVQENLNGAVNLSSIFTTEGDWEAVWRKQIDDAKAFAAQLALIAKDPQYTDALVTQIAGMGPEAGLAFVKGLTPAMVDQLNADLMSLDIVSEAAGIAMAERFKQQGVDDAEAHLAGLTSQMEKQMDKLYQLGRKMGLAVSAGYASATASIPSAGKPSGSSASTYQTGQTVNVTVQAGVGDPVAIARQIERTLQTAKLRTGRPL